MTSAEPLLSGAPGSAPWVHATEAEYKAWIYEHIPHPAARWHRMLIYRRFIESFPDLSTWFDSPLELRLGFSGGPAWTRGRTTAHEAIGYLAYLSLIRGICLDYEYLLARQFTRLSSRAAGGDGLGVDWKMFETSVGRLVQLGYAEPNARAHLTWGLTRILLHRGDPDIEAITGADVFELAEAVRAYGAREDFVALRTAMHPGVLVSRGAAERYIKNHLNKVHATHVLLFNIGQVAEPPTTGTQ